MSRISAFLQLLVNQNGTDLHLISGNPPRIRLFGEVHPVKYRNLSETETRNLLYEIMPYRIRTVFEEVGNVDFAHEEPELARFRVNVFQHLDGIGAVFRLIPSSVPTIEDLQLPAIVQKLVRQRRGLILVSGPTGSGKSTTLAAMIDAINKDRRGHIITIEDPVEYVHQNHACLVSQREVGEHTSSFAEALHFALREDPDVILVGEMRDQETIKLAVTAAEMGILVLSTVHTNGAAATIDRVINAFPPAESSFIRTVLSTSLRGIVSQHLLNTSDRKRRLAAVEVLINNSACANIIREGKTEQLENVIQSGSAHGMQTIDTVLRKWLDEKLINGDDAYRYARNKQSFEQYREHDSDSNVSSPSTQDLNL